MSSYRPKQITVTAASMQNGAITLATIGTLASWNRSLFEGILKTTAGALLVDAAVEVIQIVGGASSSLGVTFTDAKGEYGVSLPILTGDDEYRFDAYSTPDQV